MKIHKTHASLNVLYSCCEIMSYLIDGGFDICVY